MALTFEVGIDDKVSKPATDAARSMSSAAAQAKVLSNELHAVDVALLKASAVGASAKKIEALQVQHTALAGALAKVAPAADAAAAAEAREAAAKKSAAEAAKAKLASDVEATKTLGIMRDALGSTVAGLREFGSALTSGDAGGAVKGLGDAVAGAAKALDLLVPGLGQALGAVIGFGAGIAGYALGALQGLAERAIDANEKVKLLSLQLDTLSDGHSTGGAALALVDEIARSTGQARNEVAELARSFEGMGIRDLDKLQQALLASRSAVASVGPAAEGAFASLTQKLQAASEAGHGIIKVNARIVKSLEGVGLFKGDFAELDEALKKGTANAADFGDAIQRALIEKGAPAVAAMRDSLPGLANRLHNSIDEIFRGINVEPFLAALGKIVDLFSQDTASGQAMQEIITQVLQPLFDAATAALPVVRELFIDVLIAAAQAMDSLGGDADSTNGRLSTLIDGFIGVARAISIVLDAYEAWTTVSDQADQAADDLVDGLVDGIANGASRVIAEASKMAQGAVDVVKGILGIASPSLVMMSVGDNVAQGMAIGIAANDNVRSSAHDMGRTAVDAAGSSVAGAVANDNGQALAREARNVEGESPYVEAGKTVGSSSGAGPANGATIENHFDIHIDGAGKTAQEITEEMLALCFERLAAQQGLGTAAA